MKKAIAVVLSLMMILTAMLPVFAAEKTVTPADTKAEYSVSDVASGAADLNYEQIAGVLLDWIDRRIAEEAEGFDNLEVEIFGQTVAVPIEVRSLEDLLQYADHLPELGGDFANLTNGLDAFKALKRENGNVNFILGFIDYMAANADVLGKVFRWDDQVFDYGKVGEYIEANFAEGDAIRDFYDDYLVGGDIQKAFTEEIAREMGYTIPEGETFDETLNNGVKKCFLEIFGGLLSAESTAAVNAMDLRTTDVYTLVKEFVGLLQADHKADLDAALSGFMTALQGTVGVIRDAVSLEPPTASIGDAERVLRTYHPADADPKAYMPTVYVNEQYKSLLEAALPADSPVAVSAEALPEDVAALVAGDGTDMANSFVMTVKQGEETLADIAIPFADIEAFAKQAATELANSMAAGMGATVTNVDVQFGYRAYTAEGTYVMQVFVKKAAVSAEMSFNGITVPVNNLDVSSAVPSPVATVVVTNLDGEIEDLAQIKKLVEAIDTEAAYDYSLLDIAANYDAYKGAVGQANRILCGALDMLLTDEAYADLGLAEGGNENLTANLEKLCAKADGMLAMMRKYIDRDTFISMANAADIGSGFASSHGFNAGMIYDLDLSSVENALVCGIRVACDLLVEDDPDSVLYDFHLRVEDLETLDAMAAAGVDILLGRLIDAIDLPDFNYTYTPIDYANVAEDGAKDAVMAKAVEILFAAADYAVTKGNAAVNKVISEVNEKSGLKIASVEFTLGVAETGDWERDLGALVDRFIALTDGLCIRSGEAKDASGVWAKLDILSMILPMNSMFSNYDGVTGLNRVFFDKATDGDLGEFLGLFEVKEDAVAGNTPVTKALINASDYIVDSFFPDTVEAQLYDEGLTVQQIFTGNESDQGIAARNMVSIEGRKLHLVPAVLDLIRESGILPSFACDHANMKEVAEVKATCAAAGHSAYTVCEDCGMKLGYEEYPIDKTNHAGPIAEIPAIAATCTVEGFTAGSKCEACGEYIVKPASLGKTEHVFGDDGMCVYGCGTQKPAEEEQNEPTGIAAVWQRIVSFFQRIINFFKGLFNR